MVSEDLKRLDDTVNVDKVNACQTMQLATSRDGQPWNTTVYFVVYGGDFYWLSYPERRHSLELEANPHTAIAIVLQSAQPVIGIQAEGTVKIIQDITEAQSVLDLYVRKYNQGRQFVELLKAGENKHMLYRFTPRRIMLFDERGDKAITSAEEIMIT